MYLWNLECSFKELPWRVPVAPMNFVIITTSEPKALAMRYLTSSMSYQKLVEGSAKSFFKSRTGPMSHEYSKAVPEGLKNQECKKRNWKKHPPIPYRGRNTPTRSSSPTRQSSVYPSGTLGPRRPFWFTCSKPKVHVRGRVCSRTMTMQLRQNRRPWSKSKASERPSQMW